MKGVDETEQAATCANICAQLEAAGVRVKLDDRVNYNPGWKYNYWELKGVPLRLELGPKDLDKRQVCMAQRGTDVGKDCTSSSPPYHLPEKCSKI